MLERQTGEKRSGNTQINIFG